MEQLIITTSLNPVNSQIEKALELSQKFGFSYLERGKRNIKEITSDIPALVVTKNRLEVVFSDNSKLYFNPGMAKIRIKGIKKGQQDIMVKAMGLAPGMSLLDCTLGFAQDSLVAQYVLKNGRVVGIEKSKLIYVLVSEGLRSYNEDKDLIPAMRAIEVYPGDSKSYLSLFPPKCFDVVYFDYMFRKTTGKSAHILRMRNIAAMDYLEPQVLKKAREVARQRIVVKGRKEEIRNLPYFTKIVAGNDSEIAFGVIEGSL